MSRAIKEKALWWRLSWLYVYQATLKPVVWNESSGMNYSYQFGSRKESDFTDPFSAEKEYPVYFEFISSRVDLVVELNYSTEIHIFIVPLTRDMKLSN